MTCRPVRACNQLLKQTLLVDCNAISNRRAASLIPIEIDADVPDVDRIVAALPDIPPSVADHTRGDRRFSLQLPLVQTDF
jgi:hypothetical protein